MYGYGVMARGRKKTHFVSFFKLFIIINVIHSFLVCIEYLILFFMRCLNGSELVLNLKEHEGTKTLRKNVTCIVSFSAYQTSR